MATGTRERNWYTKCYEHVTDKQNEYVTVIKVAYQVSNTVSFSSNHCFKVCDTSIISENYKKA